MSLKTVLIVFYCSCFTVNCVNAQLEVAHLSSKGFSAIGYGGFLNYAVAISEGDAITGEFGLYSFRKNQDQVILAPFLLGYRYTLNQTGEGLYVEPNLGYSIGGSDIQKVSGLEQKMQGVTAGVGAGYIFPGTISINIGLRYEHVFVSGDPSPNMLSLRLSHAFSFGRREAY